MKRNLVKGMQEDNTPKSSSELLGGCLCTESTCRTLLENKDSTWSLQEHDWESVIRTFLTRP